VTADTTLTQIDLSSTPKFTAFSTPSALTPSSALWRSLRAPTPSK
jgi:hypothetical protein